METSTVGRAGMGIAVKFSLAVAILAAPLGVVGYLYVGSLNDAIAFAAKERVGERFLAAYGRIDRALADRTVAADEEAGLQAAAAELAELYARYGGELGFDDADLAARQRLDIRPQAVLTALGSLASGASPAAVLTAQRLADKSQAHTGDLSNLVLDPDLDSYYLMDAALLSLPAAVQRCRPVLAGRPDAAEASILAALIRRVDLPRIAAAVATAIAEDPFFYGADPALAGSLDAPAARTAAAGEAAAAALADPAAGDAARRAAVEAYLAAAYDLRAAALDRLDVQLATRIAAYRRRLAAGSASALAVLAVALAAVGALLARLLGRLKRAAGFIAGLAAGDLTGSLANDGGDEAARMSADLSALSAVWRRDVAALGAQTGELRARASDLEASGRDVSGFSGRLASEVESISASLEELRARIAAVAGSCRGQEERVEDARARLGAADAAGRDSLRTLEELAARLERDREASRTGRTAIETNLAAALAYGAELGRLAAAVRGVAENIGGAQDIVDAIGELSQRTRLLAMNANIEAAHAGAAGKGFGVIASAVRDLADSVDANAAAVTGRLGELRGQAAAAIAAADAAEAGIGGLRDGLDRSTGELARLVGGIDALEDGLGRARAAGAVQAGAMAELGTAVDALAGLAADIAAVASAQEDGVAALSAAARNVSAAASQGEAASASILQKAARLNADGDRLSVLVQAYRT